jgi:hypothetical protein
MNRCVGAGLAGAGGMLAKRFQSMVCGEGIPGKLDQSISNVALRNKV